MSEEQVAPATEVPTEAPQTTEPVAVPEPAPTAENVPAEPAVVESAPITESAPVPEVPMAANPVQDQPPTPATTEAPVAQVPEGGPAAMGMAPVAVDPAVQPTAVAQQGMGQQAMAPAAAPAAGGSSEDFNQWLLQGVKGQQPNMQQGVAMQPAHGMQQHAMQQGMQQSMQHQPVQQEMQGGYPHQQSMGGYGGYGQSDGYGQGYGHPSDGMHHMAAAAQEELPLPELPLCTFEVKKLRVPEIKAMLNSRGIHMEMMQGVLKKDLLEMLIEKLDEEGQLKDDPPEKKPRVYIEDDGVDEEDDDGAQEEEEDEEYDPVSDVSGAEQADDDTIWQEDV